MDFALHYAYEVHGGSHSYAAHPDDEQFLYALSDVYVALSDAECLRLAARHNINGHFHCEIIWRNGPYIGGHLAFIFKLNFKHVYNLR